MAKTVIVWTEPEIVIYGTDRGDKSKYCIRRKEVSGGFMSQTQFLHTDGKWRPDVRISSNLGNGERTGVYDSKDVVQAVYDSHTVAKKMAA